MKKYIYLIILTLGIMSCSSDEEATIDNSDLIGEWNWTATVGGINGDIKETPASIGKTYKMNLNSNYTYSLFEDAVEISSGTYELTMKESIYSGAKERFIAYSDNSQQPQNLVIIGIVKTYEINDLSIFDNNHDGIGSKFEKLE